MKNFLIMLFLFAGICIGTCFAADSNVLRDYEPIEIPRGTFIPVISAQEISTLYCDEGTAVKFIATTDLYLSEINVIPQNTEFFGYIDKINEPVVGTNASMVIKISKLKFSDGYEMPLRGYIYTANGNLIGGELTDPATYDTKPSYREGCKLVLGYVPGATRKMGEHKVIASGADLLIVLVAPLPLTHTLTN